METEEEVVDQIVARGTRVDGYPLRGCAEALATKYRLDAQTIEELLRKQEKAGRIKRQPNYIYGVPKPTTRTEDTTVSDREA